MLKYNPKKIKHLCTDCGKSAFYAGDRNKLDNTRCESCRYLRKKEQTRLRHLAKKASNAIIKKA